MTRSRVWNYAQRVRFFGQALVGRRGSRGHPSSPFSAAPSAGQGERRLARVSRGGSRTGFPPQQASRIESP